MSKETRELTPENRLFTPHEWWFAVTKTIGVPEAADTLEVSTKTIYRYRADGVTSERSTSILERFHHLLVLLRDFDRPDLALSAIDYLRSAVKDISPLVPQQLAPTMTEEQLLDYGKISDLHRAIEKGLPIESVRLSAAEVVAEINRTVAKYSEREA